MTKGLERRLVRLEVGNDDELCVITDNAGQVVFQGTNAEFGELMREVSRRGRDRRLSKVDRKLMAQDSMESPDDRSTV